MTFGKWLKRERETLGLTQAELARRLACATITLRKIEGDERRPAREVVERLAAILNIPPEQHTAFFQFARTNAAVPGMFAVPVLSDWNTLPLHSASLPRPATPLFGRQAQVEEARRILGSRKSQVLTLIGVGGIGKTRLALELGNVLYDKFADGVYFTDLAPINISDLVPFAIARTLNIRESADQSALDAVKRYLKNKNVLLILDNFEQVITAAPEVAALVRACRRLKLIVTSRERLHLDGEQTLEVPPLVVPDPKRVPGLTALPGFSAVSLFVQQARLVRREFVLNEETAGPVARICYQLEGIPLALMLAAARVRYFPVRELASLLEQRFRVLRTESEELPPRHRALEATIAWSYDLLSAGETALLRRLAVFRSGWNLPAAERVCAGAMLDEADVLHNLTRLTDKSLILSTAGAVEARFSFLETLREYAFTRLVGSGEETITRERHLKFFVEFAESAAPKLQSDEQIDWLSRLEQEHDNLRAALDWAAADPARTALGLQLANALARFWYLRGYWTEGRTRLAALLTALNSHANPIERARALNWSATLARPQDDDASALSYYQSSLELSREVGNRALHEQAYALRGIAGVENSRGEYERANEHFAASAAIFRELGARWDLAYSLFGMACEAYNLGDSPASQPLINESLSLFRESGDRWGTAVALDFLGEAARTERDYTRASRFYEEIIALRRQLNDKQGIAVSLHDLGHISLHQGEAARAAELFQESLALHRELGATVGVLKCAAGLAGVFVLVGDAARAARILGGTRKLLTTTHFQLAPVDEMELEHNLSLACALLTPDEFADALAEGENLTLEQLVRLAAG